MKLPIVATRLHAGKSLELDCNEETITLLGPAGERLGTVSWESVVDQVLAQSSPAPSTETRAQPRVTLSFKVRYRTLEGQAFEALAGGISGGGLFIESRAPLPVGTKVLMELALPGARSEWLEAKGVVAWVCPECDQYTFSSGMGVRFIEMPDDVHTQVLDVIQSCRRNA